MLYNINLGNPSREMNGFGFEIHLWPAWKEAVARRALTQDEVNTAIGNLGRSWLDACGYDNKTTFDGRERYLYEPSMAIRVKWGEWGPEHITVPGNACGLDIYDGMRRPHGGVCLSPHNVDCISQAYLLQIVFLWFANDIVLNERVNGRL